MGSPLAEQEALFKQSCDAYAALGYKVTGGSRAFKKMESETAVVVLRKAWISKDEYDKNDKKLFEEWDSMNRVAHIKSSTAPNKNE